jgi:hypothetical protein
LGKAGVGQTIGGRQGQDGSGIDADPLVFDLDLMDGFFGIGKRDRQEVLDDGLPFLRNKARQYGLIRSGSPEFGT